MDKDLGKEYYRLSFLVDTKNEQSQKDLNELRDKLNEAESYKNEKTRNETIIFIH